MGGARVGRELQALYVCTCPGFARLPAVCQHLVEVRVLVLPFQLLCCSLHPNCLFTTACLEASLIRAGACDALKTMNSEDERAGVEKGAWERWRGEGAAGVCLGGLVRTGKACDRHVLALNTFWKSYFATEEKK